jgi:hypothetical protein
VLCTCDCVLTAIVHDGIYNLHIEQVLLFTMRAKKTLIITKNEDLIVCYPG